MLMKLRPEHNFMNILRRSYTHKDPKSVKFQSCCPYLFALLGFTSVKAAHRTLMKLKPGITFEAAKKGLRGAPGNDAEDGGEA